MTSIITPVDTKVLTFLGVGGGSEGRGFYAEFCHWFVTFLDTRIFTLLIT